MKTIAKSEDIAKKLIISLSARKKELEKKKLKDLTRADVREYLDLKYLENNLMRLN